MKKMRDVFQMTLLLIFLRPYSFNCIRKKLQTNSCARTHRKAV